MSPPENPPQPIPRCPWSVWLATGLGIGFAPVAPGTWGTLWGLALSCGIAQIPSIGQMPSLWGQVLAILGLNLIGIPLCTAGAEWFRKKDPGAVVFDEIAAVPITLFSIALDFSNPVQAWSRLALGFVLFRFFDILKPPPIRMFEKLPKGLGIMADDWCAAIYGAAAMRAILAFSPAGFWWS